MLDKLIDGGPQMLLAMAALRLVSEGLLRISEATDNKWDNKIARGISFGVEMLGNLAGFFGLGKPKK